MTSESSKSEVFEPWVLEQPESLRDVLRSLRDVIFSVGYDYKEGIKWGTPNYWLPKVSRRTICYLAVHGDYVRLGFFNGASLPDSHGMMEGTGKKLRHIKVRCVDNTNRDALADYIRSATVIAIDDPDSLSM